MPRRCGGCSRWWRAWHDPGPDRRAPARYALELEIERLKLQIAKLRRQHFGTSSERSARLEQPMLALEDLEESAAHKDAEAEAKDASGRRRHPGGRWRS